jgi:hypothetical protein
MKMKILAQHQERIDHYQLEIEGVKYYYKEYLDDRGKLIDSELSDEWGTSVRDEELLNEIANRIC